MTNGFADGVCPLCGADTYIVHGEPHCPRHGEIDEKVLEAADV